MLTKINKKLDFLFNSVENLNKRWKKTDENIENINSFIKELKEKDASKISQHNPEDTETQSTEESTSQMSGLLVKNTLELGHFEAKSQDFALNIEKISQSTASFGRKRCDSFHIKEEELKVPENNYRQPKQVGKSKIEKVFNVNYVGRYKDIWRERSTSMPTNHSKMKSFKKNKKEK